MNDHAHCYGIDTYVVVDHSQVNRVAQQHNVEHYKLQMLMQLLNKTNCKIFTCEGLRPVLLLRKTFTAEMPYSLHSSTMALFCCLFHSRYVRPYE